MQDAVPMTVGQEFYAFAASLEAEIQLLQDAEKYLYSVKHGRHRHRHGHQRAQGLPGEVRGPTRKADRQAHRAGRRHACRDLGPARVRRLLGRPQELAVKLSKISSELILLTSGPRAGLFEINLPPLQPGSRSCRQVNPVMPEVMNIVAFRVMGNDQSVGLAAHHGQLQLNAYELSPALQ